MKDIIIVPVYYRPEYLFLALEKLHAATPGSLPAEVWICQDYRFEDQHRNSLGEQWTTEVLDYWMPKMNIRFIRRRQHNYEGNSSNVLRAYKEAYECEGVRFVYLVEEDVLVQPDFFTWHEAVQADGDYFCSIAYRCIRNNEARKDITDPAAYFTSARDFASIGVCWRREKLGPFVAHANEDYYGDMRAYVLKTFPGNRFQGDFSEQDGVCMRVLWEQHPARVAWPYVPRCYHLGWYGYHRPDGFRPQGLLNQKITGLRSIIYSQEEISKVSHNFGDIEQMPTEPNAPFGKLYKIQDFD